MPTLEPTPNDSLQHQTNNLESRLKTLELTLEKVIERQNKISDIADTNKQDLSINNLATFVFLGGSVFLLIGSRFTEGAYSYDPNYLISLIEKPAIASVGAALASYCIYRIQGLTREKNHHPPNQGYVSEKSSPTVH